MIPEDDAYADLDRIDLNDPLMVAYWAERWGVTPLEVFTTIRKVGPLLSDVAAQVWKKA